MRLVQISDLHFGRERPDLLVPLSDAIRQASPDLVVMAGDFVQRARASQFRPAREFMDRLEVPWLAVPGNHDIPLYNLTSRLFAPYAAYSKFISEDREPVRSYPGVEVVGLDTTDPRAHQRGKVTAAQIDRIAEHITRNVGRKTVIIVAHHPFHHAELIEKKLMLCAPDALETWSHCGPHVILSGHLHHWRVEPFVARKGVQQTLQIHTGTGLSSRVRGEPNDFAVIDAKGDKLKVMQMAVPEGKAQFETGEIHFFRRGVSGWTVASEDALARAI
jgi:predicted MPP superfamily phosphohydrolase